ncbi:glycyl radical enzyme domain-containing protein [Escherichia coli]
MKYGWQKAPRYTHSRGISSDVSARPPACVCRMAMSQIRSPICKLLPASRYYYSGISDISTLDETIKRNPQVLVQLCLVPLKPDVNLPPMSAVTIRLALPVRRRVCRI